MEEGIDPEKSVTGKHRLWILTSENHIIIISIFSFMILSIYCKGKLLRGLHAMHREMVEGIVETKSDEDREKAVMDVAPDVTGNLTKEHKCYFYQRFKLNINEQDVIFIKDLSRGSKMTPCI